MGYWHPTLLKQFERIKSNTIGKLAPSPGAGNLLLSMIPLFVTGTSQTKIMIAEGMRIASGANESAFRRTLITGDLNLNVLDGNAQKLASYAIRVNEIQGDR
jgi:hypothetical protein